MPTVPQRPDVARRQGAPGRHQRQRRGRGTRRRRSTRGSTRYGHRNVQGVAFSPEGRAYSIEHGTGRDDEVNRLVAGAQLRLGPAAAVRPALLRRVSTDDRQGPPPGGPGRGVVVGRSRPSPPPGHLHLGVRLGGVDTAAGDGRAQGPPPPGAAADRQRHRGHAAQWVRITDRGRLRVAVLHPNERHAVPRSPTPTPAASSASPWLTVAPGQNSDVWARSMPRRLS